MSRIPESLHIADEDVRVTSRSLGDGRWAVEFGGERVEVDAGCLADGGFWFTDPNGARHQVFATPMEGGLHLRVDGRTWFFASAERQHDSEGADSGDPSVITAPMTGTLVKVLCEVGDAVDEDQDLAVLSAMKMEHKLTAARAGRVQTIEAEEGASVDAGAVVIRLADA